jgi:hypothetical protein
VRDVDQRIEEPAAQQAPARRGRRRVEDVEQRAFGLAPDQRLGELEVRDRGLVEHDRVTGPVDHEPRDRQDTGRLGRARVGDHHRGGACAEEQLAEIWRGDPAQLLARAGIVERRDDIPRPPVALAQPRDLRELLGEDLARPDAHELVDERADRQLGRRELAGRRVEVRQARLLLAEHDRGQIARQLGLEDLVVEHDARGHDADDLALDEALGELGILDLLAEDHAVAELGQLGDVAARGVVRDAAHRHRVVLALVARGQREIEEARAEHRVLEEHLVEVTEPEEHDPIGKALLDVEVLPHERRLGRRMTHGRSVSRWSDVELADVGERDPGVRHAAGPEVRAGVERLAGAVAPLAELRGCGDPRLDHHVREAAAQPRSGRG